MIAVIFEVVMILNAGNDVAMLFDSTERVSKGCWRGRVRKVAGSGQKDS